jgi:hypothetical protein
MVIFDGLIHLNHEENGFKPEVEQFLKRQEGIELIRKAPIMPLQELESDFNDKNDSQPASGPEKASNVPQRKK